MLVRLVGLLPFSVSLAAPPLAGQQASPYAGFGDRDIKALSAEQVRHH
jgi:hypothetical protein